MKKSSFFVLVTVMSLALIGAISVQGYWIKQSITLKEDQFNNAVSDVLIETSQKIAQREVSDYYEEFLKLKDSVGNPDKAHYKNFFFFDKDLNTNETTFYAHEILEQDYSVANKMFDNGFGRDSSLIRAYVSERTKMVYREDFGIDGKRTTITPITKLAISGKLTEYDRVILEDVLKERARLVPIHERISVQELVLALDRAFELRGIDIDYEFGVYSNQLPTKIKSSGFEYSSVNPYKVPLFTDNEGNSDFSLHVTFPQKSTFLWRSILGTAVLSGVFSLLILLVFVSAIYQWIKQKKLSEIKSDFINNMTHEFKTPIATINLAVEALRNPKIAGDAEKFARYTQMIKEENKRMNEQVENVLQISKLDKNQLDLIRQEVDFHDIIEDAIAAVSLILDNSGGYIHTHLSANPSVVSVSEMHMTNVVVNILENAVKYSGESPKIDVYTQNKGGKLLISIKDQGPGMSKQVLKQIFEKFYRETTGDLHNIKGHGLGLAYVKKIVELHKGQVYAESEKGKGSTFHVELPLN
jgi:two-component system phosphate regulon sensor histidine kinase PhoR